MNIRVNTVFLLPLLLLSACDSSSNKTTTTPPDLQSIGSAIELTVDSDNRLPIEFSNVGGGQLLTDGGCTLTSGTTELPEGLMLERTASGDSCQITGVPTALTDSAVTISITATNATGPDTTPATVMITVAPPPPTLSYQIQLTNLTAGQPLSHPLAVLHGAGYSAFTDGSAASADLEMLAEGGMAAPLDTTAKAHSAYQASEIAANPIMPGQKATMTLETTATTSHLTVLSMLVKTNDGFTALNAELVSDLAVNESSTYYAPSWDAGTESNSEVAADLPSDTTEGFNMARSDIADKITFHSGVVSAADGLTTSSLTQLDRFDNPVMRVVVTRTE